MGKLGNVGESICTTNDVIEVGCYSFSSPPEYSLVLIYCWLSRKNFRKIFCTWNPQNQWHVLKPHSHSTNKTLRKTIYQYGRKQLNYQDPITLLPFRMHNTYQNFVPIKLRWPPAGCTFFRPCFLLTDNQIKK